MKIVQNLFTLFLWLCLGCMSSPGTLQAALKRNHATSTLNLQLNAITFKDRSGVAETVSHPERLKQYEQVNFLSCQPYQQVMRVYKRDQIGIIRAFLTQYHEDGHPAQHLEIVDNRACGGYWEWHPNGSLHICAVVLGGVADLGDRSKQTWIFDGNCYVWDSQGSIEAIFSYSKGKLDGYAYYYYPNGQIWKVVPYENNCINGCEEVYCENGELLERNYYQKGLKNGPCVRYWSGEQLAAEECFEEGYLRLGRYFDKKGDPIALIEDGNGQKVIFAAEHVLELQSFQHGLPEGEMIQYDKQGNVSLRYHLKNGLKHGEEISYHEIPGKGYGTNPRLSMNWFEGKIQGWVRTWYADGTQESQREMTGNAKNGILSAWYTDGSLMLVEEYALDKLIKGEYYKKGDRHAVSYVRDSEGLATVYDRDGNFVRKATYMDGKPQVD